MHTPHENIYGFKLSKQNEIVGMKVLPTALLLLIPGIALAQMSTSEKAEYWQHAAGQLHYNHEKHARVLREYEKIALAVRDATMERVPYELGGKTRDAKTTAFVMVDVWFRHFSESYTSFMRQVTREYIVPILHLARQKDFLIVHAAYDLRVYEETPWVEPLPGELILSGSPGPSEAHIKEMLQQYGIETLIYAGFSASSCVVGRGLGMKPMSELGYEAFLVEEATLASPTVIAVEGTPSYFWEFPEVTEQMLAPKNDIAFHNIEANGWGRIISFSDLQAALSK